MATYLKMGIFILLVLSLVSMSGNAAECKGTGSSLRASRINVPPVLLHGRSVGQTKLVLSSEPGGKELLSNVYEGNWFCIGFNRQAKMYVVGGILERGAWLPLGSIKYLREDGSPFASSAFDRLGYLAMTAVASPGGRYIVFVGGRNTTGTLHVLDSEQDTVRELGPAPAPPPNEGSGDTCRDEPYDWGTCWADGYVEMDAGIIRFKAENVLEVSYGDDRPPARAKKRRVRTFTLD